MSEIILLDEEIPYLQWWHDKSFFTLNYFNEHTRAVSDGYDDVQVRMVVSFILDKDVNLDKFHTCKHFNKINPATVLNMALFKLTIGNSAEEFFMNIAEIIGLTVVFLAIGIAVLRREKYASV